MKTSKLSLIWASKPDCNRRVAEIWIDNCELWIVVFIDDNDGQLKLELLPRNNNTITLQVDFTEVEQLIQSAKLELLEMNASRSCE